MMRENLLSLVRIRSLHNKNILTNMISPPTRALYFTRKLKPRTTPLRIRILMLFVCIAEKNNNSDAEKKKSSMVSINATVQSQIKPGIDANNKAESKAFL